MKTNIELVSARLRYYGNNSTKKSLDCQVLLGIRNYTSAPLIKKSSSVANTNIDADLT
jgi:hypothetical protein